MKLTVNFMVIIGMAPTVLISLLILTLPMAQTKVHVKLLVVFGLLVHVTHLKISVTDKVMTLLRLPALTTN